MILNQFVSKLLHKTSWTQCASHTTLQCCKNCYKEPIENGQLFRKFLENSLLKHLWPSLSSIRFYVNSTKVLSWKICSWILWNFSEQHFGRTYQDDCFWHYRILDLELMMRWGWGIYIFLLYLWQIAPLERVKI